MKEVVFKRAGLPLVMAIMLSVVSSMVARAQENPAIRQSRQFIYNEQPSKAINVLNEAIKAAPTDASLLYYLGRVQILTGQNQQAEITFQKGIDLNAKEYLNVAGKGHLRMVDNNVAEAKQLLEQALTSTKSKNAAVLTAVGDAYMANEKFNNEAVATLQKAKSAGSTDPHTYILLGDANAKLGKGGDAVSAYEKAASLDPKSGFPHYKIGMVYFRAQNKSAAEQALIKATTVEPNCILAHKELGEFYYVEKQYAKAVKSHEAYLALLDKADTKKWDDAEFKHAFYIFANKEYGRANAIFDNLANKPDASPNVYKYRAYSYTEAAKASGKPEDFDKTAVVFDEYFKKVPAESIQASDWLYHGKMLQLTKQDTLAARSFMKALVLDPSLKSDPNKSDLLQQEVAEIWFNAKRYKEAIAAYRALKKVKPQLAAKDLFTLGKAHYADTTWVSADSAFVQVIEAAPNMTVGYLWAARTKAAMDPSMKQGLAKPYFEKLIEKALENPEKGKNDLIESYMYLGGYEMLVKNNVPGAKQFYEKALALNPDPDRKKNIETVLNAIRDMNKPQPKKGGTR